MGNKIKIILEREEAIACAIALTRVKRPYGWQQDALAKINKALALHFTTKQKTSK